MKKLFESRFNNVFLGTLLFLITAIYFGVLSEEILLFQITKAICIPLLVILFFSKYKYMSVPFVSFFLFSFLGDLSSFFFVDNSYINASGILYFLSYVCLIGVILPKFNVFKVDKVVGSYLVLMLSISVYFLYVLHGALRLVVLDGFEVFLFGIKSMSLIALSFIAFVTYVNKESKSSVLLLLTVVSIVLSVGMCYTNLYYMYHDGFVILGRILYVIGLYLLFNYIIEENKNITTVNKYGADNIFA